MSMKKIKELVNKDSKIKNNKLLTIVEFGGVPKDLEHAQKRSDLRAIPIEYIWIAITYGTKKRAINALSFTIYDKDLINTSYYKYISTLRGTCVIIDYNNFIITTYWLFKAKKKY